jgi:alpha-beta hydrolase superfamily lysophospholipase
VALLDVTLLVIAAALLLALGVIVAALALVASPPPPAAEASDIFGMAALRGAGAGPAPPELERFVARDGESLAFRVYESAADQVLIFVHGSSYHGGGYYGLAQAVSRSGAAKVVLPNLRGHYLSGRRRGDVEYVGQLEDDLADLIGVLRRRGLSGPVALGGHSSGGGLALRFAGGPHAALAARFLMLAPVVPASPAVRGGNSGGWARLHFKRLAGLVVLNAFGVSGLNALPVLELSKPAALWDGTETLAYSYRLNVSLHPRVNWRKDLGALGAGSLVLIGEGDQAIDARALKQMFARHARGAAFRILPAVDHFGVFVQPAALAEIVAWLKSGDGQADA